MKNCYGGEWPFLAIDKYQRIEEVHKNEILFTYPEHRLILAREFTGYTVSSDLLNKNPNTAKHNNVSNQGEAIPAKREINR